ncbi:tetratricopeptide repeat protein [Bowmanella dokdonensis]|uniref:TPR repeat-containing protein n=1 Tax=Bowmanella dokdonensis TaxID=751969 RepID=A0A939DN58_9ALTE|nr:hypothetical protein [Bowmanella dokdonensis]MBN7825578.1 hypothetical protein [Bowmanella dokdonensis]
MAKNYCMTLALCLLPLGSFPLYALADNPLSIHQICQDQPARCLDALPEALQGEPLYSHNWYSLKLYEFASLLDLKRFDKLKQVLAPWQDSGRLPVRLQIAVLVYRAKLAYLDDNRALGEPMIRQAVALLTELSDTLPNTIYLIELANLLLYLDDMETAERILLELEQRYRSRASPEFLHELYANLAQVYNKRNEQQQHLQYRLTALEYALARGNAQQIGIAQNNAARAHQFLGLWQPAASHFQLAGQYAKEAGDEITYQLSRLRLVEMAVMQQQWQQADSHWQELDSTILPRWHQPLAAELKEKLQKRQNRD